MSEFERLTPQIERAIRRSGNTTLDGVRERLIEGSAQFWPGRETAAITEIHDERSLNVWLLGGTFAEIPKMADSAAAWGRSVGCEVMTTVDYRKGWARALKDLGFVEETRLVRRL